MSARGKDKQGGARFEATASFSVADHPSGSGSVVETHGQVEISGRLASLIEGGASGGGQTHVGGVCELPERALPPARQELPVMLAGLRVLEVARGVAGPYCGKLLGDLGADVVKVDAQPEDSGLYLYLNAGKRISPQADLTDWADVLVDNGGPPLESLRSDCVRVSVTPFGLWGPHAEWQANALIAFHSSGFAHGFPSAQVDSPTLPPLTAPSSAGDFLAGQIAACAALHGLLVRQQTGRGSHLDVSLQEAIAAENHSQFNAFQRTGSAKRQFSDVPSNATVALLPCADGWLAISPREEHQWSRWLDVMDSPGMGRGCTVRRSRGSRSAIGRRCIRCSRSGLARVRRQRCSRPLRRAAWRVIRSARPPISSIRRNSLRASSS